MAVFVHMRTILGLTPSTVIASAVSKLDLPIRHACGVFADLGCLAIAMTEIQTDISTLEDLWEEQNADDVLRNFSFLGISSPPRLYLAMPLIGHRHLLQITDVLFYQGFLSPSREAEAGLSPAQRIVLFGKRDFATASEQI